MFDGIKILCKGHRGHKEGFSYNKCLNPMLVPEKMFLKLANTQFTCPICGHSSDKTIPFFESLLQLRKASAEVKRSEFYVRYYELAIESSYEDGFDELSIHLLENEDWASWNMQISSVTIQSLTSYEKIELWENCNLKALPFYRNYSSHLTFESILRRKSILSGQGSVDIIFLKNLVKEIRNYNRSWRNLFESGLSASPVDLTHPIYTYLADVDSLDELFPECEKIT